MTVSFIFIKGKVISVIRKFKFKNTLLQEKDKMTEENKRQERGVKNINLLVENGY